MGMRIRRFEVTTFLTALLLAACAANESAPTAAPTATQPMARHSRARPAADIECPMCFTIIEYMRTGPRHQSRERTVVQCEHCCETLVFVDDGNGQLTVSTKAHPEPMPCDVCAPAPVR